MKLGEEDGNKGQQPRAVQLPQTEGQGLKVEFAELRERVSKLETTPLPDCVTEPLNDLLKRIEGLELTVLDMAAREINATIPQTPEG
jgi:hypothetical protein